MEPGEILLEKVSVVGWSWINIGTEGDLNKEGKQNNENIIVVAEVV